jgi:hypothetical protein
MVAVAFAMCVTSASAAVLATEDGTLVSAAADKLVMTDSAGAEKSFSIADATKITLDGKAAKATDLKKGDKVKITTGLDGKVTAVAATRGA